MSGRGLLVSDHRLVLVAASVMVAAMGGRVGRWDSGPRELG